MIKKLFSQSFIYGIGPQIPKVAGLLILPIISQDLTVADFGLYGIVMAYTQGFLYLKTLGTEVVLSNSFFKHPKTYHIFWRHVSGLLHIWALIMSFILGGLLIFILKDNPHAIEVALLSAVPVLLFSTTENLFFRYYQLQQRPMPISVRIVVTGLINIAVTFVTIHYLKMGYRGWFYASFIASLVGFLWMLYPMYVKRNFFPVFKLRWVYLKRTLGVSLPILPHSYGNYLLSSFDRVTLDALKVPTDVIGRYNAANLFGNYVAILAQSSKKAAGPMLQYYYARQQWDKAKRLIIYWQASFLLGTTVLSIWLKDIIPFFIRTDNMGAIHGLAVWVVMAINYIPIYGGANSQLFYFEKTKQLWQRAFIAFAFNVILNLIFVPHFGIYAAAVNTFIAYMILGYSSYFMKSYKAVKKMELNPLFWLVLTLVATALCLIVVELNWIYKAVVTIVLMGGLFIYVIRFLRLRRESILSRKQKNVG